MMPPLWGALLAGLAYGLMLGPLFFVALRQTRRFGAYAGISLWIGSLCSDLFLCVLGVGAASAVSNWIENEWVRAVLGIVAGVVLMVIGLVLWLTKPKHIPEDAQSTGHVILLKQLRWREFLTGFSINTVNVANGMFWLGTGATWPGWSGPALAVVGLLPAVAAKHKLCLMLDNRMNVIWLYRVLRFSGVLLLFLGGLSVYQSL